MKLADKLDNFAEYINALRMSMLFDDEGDDLTDCGMGSIAEQHFLKALALMSAAEHEMKLAQIYQMRGE